MLGVGLPSSLHSLCFPNHQPLISPFSSTSINRWSVIPLNSNQSINVVLFHVFQCFCITSVLLSTACFHVLFCVRTCLFWPAALVCSSLSVLRWFFASYWFPLCKATVSGTALICRCARPIAGKTVGPPQTAAAVLPRVTERTWTDLPHRRQTPNTTSMDTGLPP